MRTILVIASLLAIVLAVVARQSHSVDNPDLPYIWDLTDGEDKGIGAGFDVVDDLRQPPWLFKYTYDLQRTASVGNVKYLIPDGTAASSVHRFIGANETHLITSWSDFQKFSETKTSITAAATMGNVTLNAAFSSTKGYIKGVTKNGTRTFAYQGGIYLTFTIGFRGMGRPPLYEDFTDDVASLPKAYNPAIYGRFIRAWGTHYFTRATYGCQYNITVSADNAFLEKKDQKWKQTQMDLTIKLTNIDFGVSHGKVDNQSKVDGSFLDNAEVKANAKGGDEMKFVLGRDYDAWLASCNNMKVPIVLYSDVEPLTFLIDDPVKKANLQKAIISYGTTGVLPS